MMIAELSILGSFICFVFLFAKKVWPLFVGSLDSHIEKVKKQIESAEQMKTDSTLRLTRANQNSDNVQDEVEEYQKKSRERISQLEEENQRYVQKLREKAAQSLESQLAVELAKHKELLVDRLADLIVEKLSDKIKDKSDEVTFSKKDLEKLVS